MYHKKTFFKCWECLKYKVFGGCESQILETKMQGVETEWRRLRDIARSAATFSLDLEFNLRIRRLRRSFRGAHVGPFIPFLAVLYVKSRFYKIMFSSLPLSLLLQFWISDGYLSLSFWYQHGHCFCSFFIWTIAIIVTVLWMLTLIN